MKVTDFRSHGSKKKRLEALVRQCTQRNADIGKYGQDMDIVLIEKEASVFELHLSQRSQEDSVAVCQKSILVELAGKMA